MANQSKDATNVQLDEPMSFIGVSHESVGEGLLTGGEMTPKKLHHPDPT